VYAENRLKTTLNAIEDDPVATAMRAFINKDRSEWTGTTAKLLNALTALVGERQSKSKEWPEKPRGLTSHLEQAKASLRRVGIEIKWSKKRSSKGRTINVRYRPQAL
jgi:hypothetical protein